MVCKLFARTEGKTMLIVQTINGPDQGSGIVTFQATVQNTGTALGIALVIFYDGNNGSELARIPTNETKPRERA